MKEKKTSFKMAVCLLLLSAVIIIALMVGSYHISPVQVIQTLLGDGNKLQNFTIFQIRLPRVVLAVIVASALGVSGGILQGITRNPLAEPGIIGINAGAALFVVLWIWAGTADYYSTLPVFTVLGMPLLAMTGALLSVGLIYLLSSRGGIRPVRFILTGIGVNGGILAVITFYQLSMSKGDYNQVLTWTNGSLWGSSWNYILLTAPLVILLIGAVLFRSKNLDVLALGDELAAGVGLSVPKERLLFLLLATFLAALATSVAGSIAFLGLLGPQIAKKLTGPAHGKMLPMAALISSILLVGADVIAKNLFSPLEIPVGIVVSIVGVPYFIYLMIKER